MCAYIDKCSFYQEFANRDSFILKAMIKSYCNDGAECVWIKTYNAADFREIPAEVMPTVSYASKAFLSLT